MEWLETKNVTRKDFILKQFIMVIVGSLLLSTGCIGILVNGSSEEVTFNSSPAGADVSIDGAFAGVTPLSVDLARGESHIAEISLNGYEDESFQIKKSASGGIIIADILLTGGIGLIIDLATGGMYNLNPTDISTSMDNIAVRGSIINISMNPTLESVDSRE